MAKTANVHYMVDDPKGMLPFVRPNLLTRQVDTGRMSPACGFPKPPKHHTQEPEAVTCEKCKATAAWKAHMVRLCEEREIEPDPAWLPDKPAAPAPVDVPAAPQSAAVAPVSAAPSTPNSAPKAG